MRILLANFHNKGYGQATVVRLLARGLVARGHAVLVACPPASELERRCAEEGIPTFAGARFRKFKHLLSTARDVAALRRLLRDWTPEIVHTNGSQDAWALALARRLEGSPMPQLFTRHNTKPVNAGIANRWLYGRAIDHLILAADCFRASYAPLVAAGALDDARIGVIHQPFDDAGFDPGSLRRLDRGMLHRDLGIHPGDALIGVVARLHPYKGHRFLLAGFPAVLRAHPHARLVFLGDGDEESALRAQAQELGCAGRVHFLGYRRDAAACTACFAVAVLPSVTGEALPTVLKEAMCLGVPVLGTTAGGVPELITDGVDGLLVPHSDGAALGDGLVRLLGDGALRARLGAQGRAHALARYAPAACAQRHEELYARLLRTPRR